MYPVGDKFNNFPFVKQLVDEVSSKGNNCYVLVPFNVLHYKCFVSSKEEYKVGEGNVTVIRPPYLSFSSLKVGNINISSWLHKRALKKAFKMMKTKPDVIYGHFWQSAYAGYGYARDNKIPLFVATGESEIKRLFNPKGDIGAFTEYVSGVICVSSKNREESISLGLTTAEKCKVIPNSVNASLFHQMDREECRSRLGFPQTGFIVVFVGWFIERKGPRRVTDAIKKISGEKVYSIFVGKGEQEPVCDNILFKGSLPHNQIPLYLNAADVFILPTLFEGCCNAVVEAMACGLPIISSNRSFNLDVLDDSNSIMVNPEDTDEIASAIKCLRDNKDLRELLSKGALKKSENLTIEKRSQMILDFIEQKK